jgi:hypothetical protein
MTAGKWVIAAMLGLGLVPRVAAADYWRYQTDSGSTAFTDDAKNIPAKYRDTAERIPERPLSSYPRLSVVDPVRPAPTPNGVAEAPVPVFPWPVASAAPAQPSAPVPPQDRVSMEVDGVRIDVDSEMGQDEPISVDKRQWTDPDGNYFQHGEYMVPTTVIRRGDKPLAYIDER